MGSANVRPIGQFLSPARNLWRDAFCAPIAPEPVAPSAETLDGPAPPADYGTIRKRADILKAQYVVDLKLPPHAGKKKRGAPPKHETWLRGLYLTLHGRCCHG